ncbi:MAG: phosphoenolpyruvate synthase [Candidatus Aenigmarchaeota archaeon]|nr:phosphoenolpyruvate synthase [Candidatus Aenigmarchaeota archaeon]
MVVMKYIKFFSEIGMKDVSAVGGKNASLGELLKAGLPVPDGFAVTAEGYSYFILHNKLDEKIKDVLKRKGKGIDQLQDAGSEIRRLIKNGSFPKELRKEIAEACNKLSAGKQLQSNSSFRVAIRSSATTEDSADASFAGQQESYVNVSGSEVLNRIRECFASLFTDRAISYREDKGFDHLKVLLSVGVQKMIYSDASGVMFTIEPNSGHSGFIKIDSSWGLGDYIVQGKTDPDSYLVHKATMTIIEKKLGLKKKMEISAKEGVKGKEVSAGKQVEFALSEKEVTELAKYGIMIEKHYKKPMDIEWAKEKGKIFILQARPETVYSQKKPVYKEFSLKAKGSPVMEGIAIGRSVAAGAVNIIHNLSEINKFKKGRILVTRTTNPDWEPLMKIASGIITETGASTCHAAIVSRELGIPCIVGCQGAVKKLKNNQNITIDCTAETGKIWNGLLKYSVKTYDLSELPKTRTKIYVNVGNPDLALDAAMLPVDGVGLARQEFIISSAIKEHPLAMIRQNRGQEYVDKLAQGIAKIAAAFYPRPVIVRLSDFKTNEYRGLKGGEEYEPLEENPMIGWRGASRYISHGFEKAFALECHALRKVIYETKLSNVIIMVPFCRTIKEAAEVIKELNKSGLGKVKCYAMAEIPSNVILADQFSKYFDGFSIGSNDLTQLTLGIDRNSELVAKSFDERDESVKRMVSMIIKTAHAHKKPVGICGEAPSNYPEFAEFLVKQGIDSISVQTDAVFHTKHLVAKLEKK